MRSRKKAKRFFITVKMEENGVKLFSSELILKCNINLYS